MSISQNISEFNVGERTAMAGGILNHYYQEAGYDLSELQSGRIDNTLGGWQQSLASTKMGGITAFSKHLGY